MDRIASTSNQAASRRGLQERRGHPDRPPKLASAELSVSHRPRIAFRGQAEVLRSVRLRPYRRRLALHPRRPATSIPLPAHPLLSRGPAERESACLKSATTARILPTRCRRECPGAATTTCRQEWFPLQCRIERECEGLSGRVLARNQRGGSARPNWRCGDRRIFSEENTVAVPRISMAPSDLRS